MISQCDIMHISQRHQGDVQKLRSHCLPPPVACHVIACLGSTFFGCYFSRLLPLLPSSWRHCDKAFKMISHLLFETASGYGIFEANLHEEIGSRSQAVQDSIKDLAKFGKMVSLISFSPFKNAAEALQNANDISEGQQWLAIIGALTEWFRRHRQ